MKVQIVEKIIIFALYYLQASWQYEILNCQNTSPYSNNNSSNPLCLECIAGYNLNLEDNSCNPSSCEDFLYLKIDQRMCSSTCPNDQMIDQQSQQCQIQNFCPNLIDVGQSFNQGNINKFILISYIDDKSQLQSEIISLSQTDNNINIWDANTGQIKTQFIGHSQAIIVSAFLQEKQLLVTFSQNGEVIIWNYSEGRIQQKLLLNSQKGEQLTDQSEVNINDSTVTMFGFQGEFYIVNFITQQFVPFFAHTKVVFKVILINSINLISYAYDGQIILWYSKVPNNFLVLSATQYCPYKLDYILISSSTQQQLNRSNLIVVFFGNIEETISTFQELSFIQLDQVFPIEDLLQINNSSVYTIDLGFIILDFIIDRENEHIIVYSQNKISILLFNDSTQKWQASFQYSLDDLNLKNIVISQLYLSNNLLAITTSIGHIYTLNYTTNQNQILQSFLEAQNLSFKFKRPCINGIQVDANKQTFYVYGDQIISFDLQNNQIKYIITNFLQSQLKHTKKINSIYHSVKRQFIATAGDDGLIFLYNYIDGALLHVLTHPNYTLETTKSKQLLANQVIIISDSIICASFSDQTAACYMPPNGKINYIFQMKSDIMILRKDDVRNYVLIFTLDQAFVYDLSNAKLVSSIDSLNSFWQTRFIAELDWLTSYTKYGSTYVWKYPQLSLLYYADNKEYNPDNTILNEQNSVTDNNINFTYYQNGLLIIRYYNLTYYKSIQYSAGLNRCGLQYPQFIWCGANNGALIGFGIFSTQIIEKRLYNFPILEGKFTKAIDLTFILIDYGSYGSGLQVGNVQNFLADQAYQTSSKIVDSKLDENMQRIQVADESGIAQAFTYIKKTNKITLNSEKSAINKIILIQSEYLLVTLSNIISIKNYFSMNVYGENSDHLFPVKDAIIDSDRALIISISDHPSQNLHYWFYKLSKSGFLLGHTSSVSQLKIDKNTKSILSCDLNGNLIIWNYDTLEMIQKIDFLHKKQAIIQLNLVQNINYEVITLGQDNNVCIFNYKTSNIISRILVDPQTSIQIDNDKGRLFILNRNIKVYNIKSGLKITELQGFDDKVQVMLLYKQIIVAYARLNIVSFDRDTLNKLFSGKSSFPIYKGLIIKDVLAFISNSTDSTIKLWNYMTGTMLADMENLYYPDSIKEIYVDQSAGLLIAINIKNQLFIYNPFIDAVSKILHYLLQANPPKTNLNSLAIDPQNNIMIVYSKSDIVTWNYYTYLGVQGQRLILPNDPQINFLYSPQQDKILFFDKEQNIWSFKNNELRYLKYIDYTIKFVLEKQGVIIIGESKHLMVYNQDLIQIQVLEFGSISCHNHDQIPYIFVICEDFYLYQFEIANDLSLKQVTKYQLNNQSRIANSVFNIEYSHIILYDISGTLLIIDYDLLQVVAKFTDHTGPIRQVKFSVSIKILVSCSDDKNILIYTYERKSVSLIQTLPQSGFVLKILIDIPLNRLFFWVNLSQEVKILDISNKFQQTGIILAPSNTSIDIVVEEKYNLFIIHNLFQINFYTYTKLKFLYFIRTPSVLFDITQLRILNNELILIVTKNCLQLVYYTQTTIELIKQYQMEIPQVIQANILNRVITLKGINQKTIFNYTMVEDYSDRYSKCIQMIDNPNSYFKLQRGYYLLQTSLSKSQIDIKNVQYIIKVQQDSSFYLQNQLLMNQYGNQQVSLKYSCIQKLPNGQYDQNYLQMFSSPQDYNLDSLVIESCRLKFQKKTNYSFHEETKNFTFTKISYRNNIAIENTLQFDDIDTFIVDDVLIQQSKLIKEDQIYPLSSGEISTIQNNPYTLFDVDIVGIVYINQLKVVNCTIRNYILFKFQEADRIIIKDLVLQDIKFTGNILFDHLFDIKNADSLLIENVIIQNVESENPFVIFDIAGVSFAHIKNITLTDSTNCSLFKYSKEFQQDKFYKTIRDDYLLVENIRINLINSKRPLIQLQSDFFQLLNLTATNNTCNNCYGTVLNIKNSAYKIDSCKFISNVGFYGGAIYIQNSLTFYEINNTLIQSNSADSGGGILLDQSDLILQNSNITQNSAYIGGGIRYLNYIPQFINQFQIHQNKIIQNTAEIFGRNIASYPRNILITKAYQSDEFTVSKVGEQYQVSNFRSGEYLKLLIQLVDEESNIIQVSKKIDQYPSQIAQEVDNYNIEFVSLVNTQITGQSFLTMDHYNLELFGFQLDEMIVTAEPENSFYLKVLSSSIKTPNSTYSTFNNNQFTLKLQIQTRPCLLGEIYIPQSQVQNSYCKPCPKGSYSLRNPEKKADNMNCINCPQEALSCEGKEIYLRNGYWRESNSTDIIIECTNNRKNCIAEDINSKFYCKKGYVGPLCEICDSSGQVWGDIYVSLDQKKTCIQLEESYAQLAYYFAIVMAVISYIIYAIFKTIQNAKKSLYCYYLRMIGIASFGRSESGDMINVQIKLLMHFYYLSSIVQKTLKIEIPIDFVSQAVSTPIQSFQITQMSLIYLKRKNERENIFKKQILIQSIPFIFIVFSFVILNTIAFYKRKNLNRSTLINSIVFIFIFFQPDILSSVLSMAQCRTIGLQKYVAEDIMLQCLDPQHFKFLLIFTLPIFLLWSIIFPSILLNQIRKYRQELFKCQPTLRYGFLYKEYKKSEFFWEFVRMNSRTIIIIINALCYEKTLQINQLTCLVLLLYFVLIIRYHPFNNHMHNKQDQAAHILLILVYVLHTITLSEEQSSIQNYLLSLIITAINYTYIIYLFWSIISEKFVEITHKLIYRYPRLQNYINQYDCCKKIIRNTKNLQQFNLIPVFKRWRLISKHILGGYVKTKRAVPEEIQSSVVVNNQQILSQNNLTQSSNLSLIKNRTFFTNISPQNLISRDDESISKNKSQFIELSQQSLTIKLQKVESIQNSIKQYHDLQASDVELNVGANFQQYINNHQASKSVFTKINKIDKSNI